MNFSILDRNYLKVVIELYGIKRGEFILSSGSRCSYYLDCRNFTMRPDGMRTVGRNFANAIWDMKATVVTGLESGAIPIVCSTVAAIKTMFDIDVIGTFVRKQERSHGAKNPIEGKTLTENDRVVIVEDVVTSGNSVIKAIQAVKSTPAQIIAVICILDKQEGGAEKIQQECGLPLLSMFKSSDLNLINTLE